MLTRSEIEELQKEFKDIINSSIGASVVAKWIEHTDKVWDDDYNQYVPGTGSDTEGKLELRALATEVTPHNVERLNVGNIDVGDLIFKFPHDTELNDHDGLVIEYKGKAYNASPISEGVPVGDTCIYKYCKGRLGKW